MHHTIHRKDGKSESPLNSISFTLYINFTLVTPLTPSLHHFAISISTSPSPHHTIPSLRHITPSLLSPSASLDHTTTPFQHILYCHIITSLNNSTPTLHHITYYFSTNYSITLHQSIILRHIPSLHHYGVVDPSLHQSSSERSVTPSIQQWRVHHTISPTM